MADQVFNFAKGAAVEMFNDAAANGIVLLMKANEAETTLIDRTEGLGDVRRLSVNCP